MSHLRPRLRDLDLALEDVNQFRDRPSGKIFRWEFFRNSQEIALDVPGALTLDHLGLMAETAAGGLGIAYVPAPVAQPYIDNGKLIRVLEEWCPPIPGLFLYYPGNRHVPLGLRAFIDVLKELG